MKLEHVGCRIHCYCLHKGIFQSRWVHFQGKQIGHFASLLGSRQLLQERICSSRRQALSFKSNILNFRGGGGGGGSSSRLSKQEVKIFFLIVKMVGKHSSVRLLNLKLIYRIHSHVFLPFLKWKTPSVSSCLLCWLEKTLPKMGLLLKERICS